MFWPVLTALTFELRYRIAEGRLAPNDSFLAQVIPAKTCCWAADRDRHAAQTVAP